MSVINKMHQDFRDLQQEEPVIVQVSEKKNIKKRFIITVIFLLLISSLCIAYLIVNQQKKIVDNPLSVKKTVSLDTLEIPVKTPSPEVKPQTNIETVKPVNKVISDKKVVSHSLPNVAITQTKQVQQVVFDSQPVSFVPALKKESLPIRKTDNERKSTGPAKSVSPASHLKITTVQPSKVELAQIRLKEAQIAEDKGLLKEAADKREEAITFDPTLNEVRRSLALYYYSQGNLNKTKSLLQDGAIISPDYSDFNLMLSRLALKEGDFQKAYLYLNQHPPTVVGHLDYYASYAALAQKFGKYSQSEDLYRRLLSQRPNNGRWRMAMAISQDKQSKVILALTNYKNALLQPDLSSKAKDYINQRIRYLEKNL